MHTQDPRKCLQPRVATLCLLAAAAPALAAPAKQLAATAPPAPRAAPPANAAPTANTQASSYGGGTLSLANGNYQFAPEGCTHNGNRAICNFYVTYSGAASGNVNAWAGYYGQWTMNVQLVDNLHVPHGPDTAYFIDASGTHQPVLFLQRGTQVWVSVEFPNVDGSVTNGEFHMGNQIVGGVPISQPNAQGAVASSPQLAMVSAPAATGYATPSAAAPAATAPAPNCAAGTPGYSGAALCNVSDKVNVAKGWQNLLGSFIPAKAAPQQAQMQAPQMQAPQMQPPQMQPPQMQPPAPPHQ